MSESKLVLTQRLYAARELHAEHTRSRDNILELLKRADLRRKVEAADLKKWDQVLDQLESSLDVAKAHVAASGHRLLLVRRELQDLLGDQALAAIEEAQCLPEGEDDAQSIDERLQQIIGSENAAAALNDEEADAASAPLIEESKDAAKGPSALESAIEKIKQHRADTLSPREVRATQAAYARLSKMRSPKLKDERLMRILGAAVKVFQRKRKKK